jgi:hypothetical protein
MKILRIGLLPAIAVVLIAACGTPPKVVQGTVVSYDGAAMTMVIRDEADPGRTLELSLEEAEIGAVPVPGDKVRIAYNERDGKLRATRVMNITRQAELK